MSSERPADTLVAPGGQRANDAVRGGDDGRKCPRRPRMSRTRRPRWTRRAPAWQGHDVTIEGINRAEQIVGALIESCPRTTDFKRRGSPRRRPHLRANAVPAAPPQGRTRGRARRVARGHLSHVSPIIRYISASLASDMGRRKYDSGVVDHRPAAPSDEARRRVVRQQATRCRKPGTCQPKSGKVARRLWARHGGRVSPPWFTKSYVKVVSAGRRVIDD